MDECVWILFRIYSISNVVYKPKFDLIHAWSVHYMKTKVIAKQSNHDGMKCVIAQLPSCVFTAMIMYTKGYRITKTQRDCGSYQKATIFK